VGKEVGEGTYVLGIPMTVVRQCWGRPDPREWRELHCTRCLEGLQMGMGGMAVKGQSMVGGRVAQIKRAVVRQTAPSVPAVDSSRAARRHDRGQGTGGGDRDTTGCIPLHFVPCAPPCAVTGRPEGKVWEWEWECPFVGVGVGVLCAVLRGEQRPNC